MLRGSFQPQRRRVRREIGAVALDERSAGPSSMLGALIAPEALVACERLVDPAIRERREVERVLVRVELGADEHPAGADDAREDARAGAARRADDSGAQRGQVARPAQAAPPPPSPSTRDTLPESGYGPVGDGSGCSPEPTDLPPARAARRRP